jgi:hypothetical protein
MVNDETKDLVGLILFQERQWIVDAKTREPICPPQQNRPMPTDNNEIKDLDSTTCQPNRSSGMSGYWSKFTPEERSKMIKARKEKWKRNAPVDPVDAPSVPAKLVAKMDNESTMGILTQLRQKIQGQLDAVNITINALKNY